MTVIGLGIDGGGSKTEALLLDDAGHILGVGRAGPSNTFFVTEADALAAMRAAVDAAMDSPPRMDALAVSAKLPDALIEALSVHYDIPRWRHLEEPESALAAGQPFAGVPIRVVVCAGTGSMAMGVGAEDERLLAGAAGPIVGDEGSAYWLGQQALTGMFHALDGRRPPSPLTKRLPQYLDTPASFWPLLHRVYGPPAMSRHEIAALAPLVTEMAAAGDPLALELTRKGARELGRLVHALGRRLDVLETVFGVQPYGGVFRAGEMVLSPFRDAVRTAAPRAEVLPPIFRPVLGAALRALEHAGAPLPPEALHTLREARARWKV